MEDQQKDKRITYWPLFMDIFLIHELQKQSLDRHGGCFAELKQKRRKRLREHHLKI